MNKKELLKTLGGFALGLIAFSALAGLIFITHWEEKSRSLIDQAAEKSSSFCPQENSVKVWGFYEMFPPKIPRRIAVVIDATDKIPGPQRSEIVDWFKHEFVDTLAEFSKVTMYQLNESISDEQPEFEKCAPPWEANPWIENPRMVREKFEEGFHNQLLVDVESLASGDEKKYSPILEMIEKIFDTHDEMILVSDLMQNTFGYSLYKNSGNHDYRDFLSSPYTAEIIKNQQDKKLTAIYITRKKLGQWQNKELREFWREYMESNGGEFELARTLSVVPY